MRSLAGFLFDMWRAAFVALDTIVDSALDVWDEGDE